MTSFFRVAISTLSICSLFFIDSLVDARCQPVSDWTPSFPVDFSQHPLQSLEDNWMMCNLYDEVGNNYGLNSFQVRADYAAILAANLSSLEPYVPMALDGILECGCELGPCLAVAVDNLAISLQGVASYLQMLANTTNNIAYLLESQALSHIIPGIQALALSLLQSPVNSPLYFPQLVNQVIAATIPDVNPNAHYLARTTSEFPNIDMSIASDPAVPERYNGPTFAYNQDPYQVRSFDLSISALDYTSGTPITGQLEMWDQYGPQLWGPTNSGVYAVKTTNGAVSNWTQVDQPWMFAKGVLNAGGVSRRVYGDCWNSRQWTTSSSIASSSTGPYIWIPFVSNNGIAGQFSIFYQDTHYDRSKSLGSANIIFPVCSNHEGRDENFNENNPYTVDINGKRCHAGPMLFGGNDTFTFELSNPWNSTHGTGQFFWQQVRVISSLWDIDLTVNALVPDNEIGWQNSHNTYSDAIATGRGRIRNMEITTRFATIEHLTLS